jgi:acyl-coenzyme A thioesterase PaaI-like protein
MKPDFLKTDRTESFKTWRFRVLMNAYPMYFGTGGRILFWSGDSREVQLRLSRNIWTYNYVGTIFGGAMFAAADPFYMLMLLRSLGNSFVVWDKSASIRFRKPGRTTLYLRYLLTDEDLASIRADVLANGRTERTYTLQWLDKEGVVHAEIERLCYIADKKQHQQRTGDSQQVRLER